MSETAKREVIEIPGEDGGTITFDYNSSRTVAPNAFEPQSLNTVDKVVIGAFFSVAVGLVGLAGWFGWKDEQKKTAEYEERQEEMKRKRAEREAWFDKQRKEGKVVIETRSGEWMAIPSEAYAKAEIRKKAL